MCLIFTAHDVPAMPQTMFASAAIMSECAHMLETVLSSVAGSNLVPAALARATCSASCRSVAAMVAMSPLHLHCDRVGVMESLLARLARILADDDEIHAWLGENAVDDLLSARRQQVHRGIDLCLLAGRRRTRTTWSRKRCVIGKAEWSRRGGNPRFVVTSLRCEAPEEAKRVYREIYCARGDMENRIFVRRSMTPSSVAPPSEVLSSESNLETTGFSNSPSNRATLQLSLAMRGVASFAFLEVVVNLQLALRAHPRLLLAKNPS